MAKLLRLCLCVFILSVVVLFKIEFVSVGVSLVTVTNGILDGIFDIP